MLTALPPLLLALALNPLMSVAPPPTPHLHAREQRQPTNIVRATAAQIQSEQIAGAWFHTLRATVVNNTGGSVSKVFINYEIYAPNSSRILTAGKAAIQPQTLLAGEEGRVQLMVNQAGRVKITLVEWVSAEKGYRSYEQMQDFT